MPTLNLKDRAINYRKQGFSYGMINELLGVPKSTLSGWLSRIEYSPNKEVIKRMGKARAKSGEVRHEQKLSNIKKAKDQAIKEVGSLSKRDIFMLGLGLYWGEGDKISGETVRLMNSDPTIINTTIAWLENICNIQRENIILALHAYPDNNIEKCINYWSKKTSIPKNQFHKTQIDQRTNKKRTKRRLLPYGTIKLVVKSNGNKELGVFLHRKIIGYIGAVTQQLNMRE